MMVGEKMKLINFKNIFVKKIKKLKKINYNSLTIKSIVCLLFFGVAVVSVMSFISYNENKKFKLVKISDKAIVKINDGKEEKGNLKKITFKRKLKKYDKIVIKMKTPKDINIDNVVVAGFTCNSILHVYCDDKQIYKVGEGAKYGDVIGSELFKASIDDDCSNKEIKMVIDVLDTKAA